MTYSKTSFELLVCKKGSQELLTDPAIYGDHFFFLISSAGEKMHT